MKRGVLAMGLAAAACTTGTDTPVVPFGTYLGSETRLLDGDLVQFKVSIRGQLVHESLTNYADCVAAQYTLIRGYSHARHVRTNVYEEGSIWSADAVYTISPTTPRGLKTIDAIEKVEACEAEGIPTV